MTNSVTTNPNGPSTASTSTATENGSEPHIRSRESSGETRSSESSIPPVPRVGGVRCYWALLRPSFPTPSDRNSKFELTFVHFDPVLSIHLKRERLSMLGRGVIEFIHPNEREQARKDLAGAIAVDDLQGSVTRVRYARLSRIRTLLGCSPEDLELPSELEKIAEDQDFLILDLVLNWAADGLLLGFFHAIRDLDTRMNNDPAAKHMAWSNWCGTENMPEDQIQSINENIHAALRLPKLNCNPPTRVFQIHTTETAPTRPDSTIFTWPPCRPENDTADASAPLHDGLYDADEYKYLMKGVDMDPSSMAAPEDARTNCTTRFGAKHSLNSEGVFRQINSVFIPYGSIIFSCFQTTQTIEQGAEQDGNANANPFSLPNSYEYPPRNGHTSLALGGIPVQDEQWVRNAGPGFNGYSHKQVAEDASSLLGKRHRDSTGPGTEWRPAPPPASASHHFPPLQGYPGQAMHAADAGPSRFNRNGLVGVSPSYPQPEYLPPDSAHYPYNTGHYVPSTGYQAVSHARGSSPSDRDSVNLETRIPFPATSASNPTPAPAIASIPPSGGPHRHYPPVGPVIAPHPHNDGGFLLSPKVHSGSLSHPAEKSMGSSRPLVKPPGGVTCCRACGTTESPEWRKSESGIKDLCNACGLRLARAQAKKEGRQKPRKKKDKLGASPS